MNWKKPPPVSDKVLRIFSLTFSFSLIGISFLNHYFHRAVFEFLAQHRQEIFIFCGLYVLLAQVLPRSTRYFYQFWALFAMTMGWLNLQIFLLFSFYCLFTPLAFFFRLVGRDILKLKKKSMSSYWETYDAHPTTLERYRRLF